MEIMFSVECISYSKHTASTYLLDQTGPPWSGPLSFKSSYAYINAPRLVDIIIPNDNKHPARTGIPCLWVSGSCHFEQNKKDYKGTRSLANKQWYHQLSIHAWQLKHSIKSITEVDSCAMNWYNFHLLLSLIDMGGHCQSGHGQRRMTMCCPMCIGKD